MKKGILYYNYAAIQPLFSKIQNSNMIYVSLTSNNTAKPKSEITCDTTE